MANKDENVERKKAEQSLGRMLEVIGPYLPKRLFGQAPLPSDWQISQEGTLTIPRRGAARTTRPK